MMRGFAMFRAWIPELTLGVLVVAAIFMEGSSWKRGSLGIPWSEPIEKGASNEAMVSPVSDTAAMASKLGVSDPTEGALLLGDKSLEEDPERILRLRTWCEADPEAMTAWAMKHLAGRDRTIALKQAAAVWFAADPESARRWAGSLVEEHERNAVLLEIGFEMARLQPEDAVDLAAKLPVSPMRDELIVHSVRQWAGVDPSAASVWSSRLPESRLREEVVSALAVSLAVDRGEDAAVVVARSMALGKQQGDSAVLVARSWGVLDPESAGDWIVGFQDPVVREAAMRELAVVWVERSPERMSSWIASLADDSIRQQMLDVVGSVRRYARPAVEGPAVGISP